MNKIKNINDEIYDLEVVCQSDQIEMVNLAIKKGAMDFGEGLFVACREEYIDIINILNDSIEKHIDFTTEKKQAFFNAGLWGACEAGNITMINLMIEKGADNFNYALISACRRGDLDIINLIINYGANDFNYGLLGACYGGHIDIIDMMIKKGASNFNFGLHGACYNGSPIGRKKMSEFSAIYVEIIDMMVKKGADINTGLCAACQGGNIKIIDLMIEKGANNFNLALHAACLEGNIDIIHLMIEKGASDFECGLKMACHRMHINIIKLMIMHGASNFTMGLNECMSVCEYYPLKQIKIIDILLEYGALIKYNHLQKFSQSNFICAIIYNSCVIVSHNCYRRDLKKDTIVSVDEAIEIHLEDNPNEKIRELLVDHKKNQLWKKERHAIFPSNTKNKIYCFMLVFHRIAQQFHQKIPKPLLWMIVNFFIRQCESLIL